ncbi:MAG: YeeE/YedE family protein [Proteobacteria bacterium]|nr:YeeE/YedE family protein [Pseudomonadota bacterium]MBU1233017.1 YeeE/YedE family protein [Pseudomonadota bacterium]MBU1419186.1 YeeE/YedE family protein [Pseudomonadota bacterium]MBU1455284.1 YeeE/YedE family protein [Pseudomonadota bacterium]
MSDNVLASKAKGLYQILCQDNWGKNTVAILVALLSILMLAWDRPWGAVGAVRNWGEWIIYGTGLWDLLGFADVYDSDTPKAFLTHTGSVIGIGFIGGAFLSACLGGNFALRIPPKLEMVKAVFAGIFMGAGATLAGGCNVGGFYNAIGNLSAHGFAMMAGLIIGAILGLKYVYWEMENISWGASGGKTINLPGALQILLGIATLAALLIGAYTYTNGDIEKLGGVLLITALLGYAFQRGRWCMIQGFREPHMTGNAKMAKSIALSIVILAIGIAIIKSKYIGLSDMNGNSMDYFWKHYVRGTFGWGGVVGGILFAFGAIQAGGCGTGTLWRVGEGQIKLWIVTPFFGMACAVGSMLSKKYNWEGSIEEGSSLGSYVYLPHLFGYSGTLALIFLIMAVWYLIVAWNEETNKLMLEM